MLRLLLIVLSTICLSTTLASAQSNMLATPITMGESYQVPSSILDDTREINVWLPSNYADNDQNYPVLYVMDGARDQDFHHISGLAQLATINGQYEALIVVGIGTKNRLMELTAEPKDPRYIRDPVDSGAAKQFRRHIAEEVIPLIENRYRTNQRRAIIGESLAGLFITDTFLNTPDLFTDYIAISPSLWWDDRALAKQAIERLKKHDNKKRHLYLTMANEGGTMQSGLDMIVTALSTHAPSNLDWVNVDRSTTETHATIYHGAAHDALIRLFGIPAQEYDGPDPWYLQEGGEPPS